MREKDFLSEVGEGAKAIGAWWYKIPDTGPVAKKETRFYPQRPFDAIMDVDLVSVAIEAKVVKKGGRLLLKEHQQANLLRRSAFQGHLSYIIVRVEGAETKFGTVKTHVVAVPIKRYAQYMLDESARRQRGETVVGTGIPWGMIKEFGLELARIPGNGWDLEPLLVGTVRRT